MADTVSLLNLIIAFGVFLLMGVGILLGNNRYRDGRTRERFAALHAKIDAVDARIDDTRESFVHNDHLQHIAQDFKDALGHMRTEQRSTNERIDKVLERMTDKADGARGGG